MRPLKHLVLGILFAFVLFKIFPIGIYGFSLIVLSTFFIDVDHYFLYVFKKRDLSLRNAYHWFVKNFDKRILMSRKEKQDYKYGFLLFHGLEFWIILAVLSIYSDFFLYIFIGVMFHIFLDFLALAYYNEPFAIKISQTYNFIRDKDKREM